MLSINVDILWVSGEISNLEYMVKRIRGIKFQA